MRSFEYVFFCSFLPLSFSPQHHQPQRKVSRLRFEFSPEDDTDCDSQPSSTFQLLAEPSKSDLLLLASTVLT